MNEIQPSDAVYKVIKTVADNFCDGCFDGEEDECTEAWINMQEHSFPLMAAALITISSQLEEMKEVQTEILMQLRYVSEKQIDRVVGSIYECH